MTRIRNKMKPYHVLVLLVLVADSTTSSHNIEPRVAGRVFSLKGSSSVGVAKLRAVNVTNLGLSKDPVTEWLKELLDFVLKDIYDVEILEKQVVNKANPYLDLSNLYNSSSGKFQ